MALLALAQTIMFPLCRIHAPQVIRLDTNHFIEIPIEF